MVARTIGQILKDGVEILRSGGTESPILDCQLLLAKCLNVDKLYVMTNIDKEVAVEVEKLFFKNVAKRAKGMPVQYILGYQEFMGLKFNVNQSVLVPRADTEVLVEEIIKDVEKTKEYKILDIGTGSGCISISLAKYIDTVQISTVDISKEALDTAKANAKLNDVENKINFYNGNIFEPFRHCNIIFDIIVSNPPYIPTHVIEKLQVEVKDFEPRGALDGGQDGLDFYRTIISEAPNYLKSGGRLYFEIGYDQGEDVTKLLGQANFADIDIVRDLAGRDRVVKARLI